MNKIKDKELEKVVEQQKTLNEVLTNIGVLETQKHGLLHKVAALNKDIEEVKNDLEGKYGAININLEDGTYTKVDQDG
jgi:uncharacterized protein YoxC|tara:strand:- start:220 stop:453 length:234 start_codon:yes stop_codon:yes gene_type:complete